MGAVRGAPCSVSGSLSASIAGRALRGSGAPGGGAVACATPAGAVIDPW